MLGTILSTLVMMVLPSAWSEVLTWILVLMWIVTSSSSDSADWKSSLLGETDSTGWSLSVLSLWVIFLALLGSKSVKFSKSMLFFFVSLMSSLLSSLLVSFYVSDFIFFYLGFETCLVPIFTLILGWGYQPERAQAGVYMVLYTLLGSLPLFFFFVSQMNKGCSYMYGGLAMDGYSALFFFFLVGAFLVKFPMYSVHLWLLKAHVEAPVAGSMVLAGVLLKLGGYGLVRVLPVLSNGQTMLSEAVLCTSVWGSAVVSVSCLRQMDMKLLIASSSVVHMGLCISGLFVLSEWGLKGTMSVMIGHGLCSSGLFYLANVVYERSGSRSLSISKGMLSLMPSMCLWWFVLVGSNMASPPSLNLLGEILLIITVVSWSSWTILGVMILSFFSAAYSLYLFSLSQQGVYLSTKSGFHSGYLVEYLVSVGHWAPLNVMAACTYWFI
uniref:NADH dehydrogenase subunit 4 n=1 Tax=Macrohectopus branickii TaxID=65455 RepID=UPI001D128A8C|nr:NADH dehydrogenase subunit 4 [Macrohectopus branickii]UCL27461.1 NADH dehydrogenase subunit 4 [Macrohectopus branickii]